MALKLAVESAGFAYEAGQNVLKGLSLALEDNDLFCVLGPNGCGKSTLLKCVAGMLSLASGTVRLQGRELAQCSRREIARTIGYIPQEHLTSFPFTVEQVVVMGRAPHLGLLESPSDEDLTIAREAINEVGIAHLTTKRFTEISGGERQLVLVARVLAQEPRILLLDEPTSHLDFCNQTLVLELVRHCADRGYAVLMTTHFPNQALAYATRVALMRDGEFVAQGTPDDVITESSLRDIYGIDVSILTAAGSPDGPPLRFCLPASAVRRHRAVAAEEVSLVAAGS